MRVALVLPPLTQLNAPYPSIAYLARALRAQGEAPILRDLGIELVWSVFGSRGLPALFDAIEALDALPEPAWRALAMRAQHTRVADPVLRFLSGRDRALAPRIVGTPFLPRSPRLEAIDLEGFGPDAVDDSARRLATAWLADLADLVTSTIDPDFALSRYGHRLAAGVVSFDPLLERLQRTTPIDAALDALADTIDADVVGLSVPFPGNLYGALRIGARLRDRGAYVILGGGYVNTELREVDEPRLWRFVDALTLDDGEGPLTAVLAQRRGGPDARHRTRTAAGPTRGPAAPTDVPAACAADWTGLDLSPYLALVDTTNPALRLWGDGRWNKITVAHGCYWRQCTFCDTGLDYVAGYAPNRTEALLDAIDDQVRQTGQSGVHFVDEAAPPRGLRDLAIGLLARGTMVSWWGNIRFERAFTPDLARLLAAAGLVAVTGGLEVASDRLLARMNKGVTIEQVARAARSFQSAGTMVHAYLMYGFPTQTEQETVDALEIVRQMFVAGLLTSGFWHRFVLTRHAPMYAAPERFGLVVPADARDRFARNDVDHLDPHGADHDRFDAPLDQAIRAWLSGRELDRPAHSWIPGAPPTSESPDRIARALAEPEPPMGERLIWLGGDVLDDDGVLVLHGVDGAHRVSARKAARDWLWEVVEAARPGRPEVRLDDARAAFPGDWDAFATRWGRARAAGLVGV